MKEGQPITIEQLQARQDRLSGLIKQRASWYSKIGHPEAAVQPDTLDSALKIGRVKSHVVESIDRHRSTLEHIRSTLEYIAPAQNYLQEVGTTRGKLEELKKLADQGHVPSDVYQKFEADFEELSRKPDLNPGLKSAIELLQGREQRKEVPTETQPTRGEIIFKPSAPAEKEIPDRYIGPKSRKSMVGMGAKLINLLQSEYSEDNPANRDAIIRRLWGEVNDTAITAFENARARVRTFLKSEDRRIAASKKNINMSKGEVASYYIEKVIKHIRPANLEVMKHLLENPDIDSKELVNLYGQTRSGKKFSGQQAARSMAAAVRVAETNVKENKATPEEIGLLQRIDDFVEKLELGKRGVFLKWFYDKITPKAPKEIEPSETKMKIVGKFPDFDAAFASFQEGASAEKSKIPHAREETLDAFYMLLDKPDTNLQVVIEKMGKMKGGKRYSRGTTYKALLGALRTAEENKEKGMANENETVFLDCVEIFMSDFQDKESFLEWLKNKFEIANSDQTPATETIEPAVEVELAVQEKGERLLTLETQRPTIRQDINGILDIIESRKREYFTLGHMDRFFGIGPSIVYKAVGDKYIKPTRFQGGQPTHPLLSKREATIVFYKTKYSNDLNARRLKELNVICAQEMRKREAEQDKTKNN